MRVTLIAETKVDNTAIYNHLEDDRQQAGFIWATRLVEAGHAQLLAEFAGRACYQSWKNRAGRSNAEYIGGQIVAKRHFSVIEHASASFYITGISRSCTHELIRHRHLSYSELSQRYTDLDEHEIGTVSPPLFDAPCRDGLTNAAQMARNASRSVFGYLVPKHGRKPARGAARAFLPEATETRIVVSGNHRAWREMLTKRLSPHADEEIRQLAEVIYGLLLPLAPQIYEHVREEAQQ